jgi:hypothetical protein
VSGRRRLRAIGLLLVAAGAAFIVVSTFLPWLGSAGVDANLWELTGPDVVVVTAGGLASLALAALGLARGGRDLAAGLVAAALAGFTLVLVDDIHAFPEDLHRTGGEIAVGGSAVALAGALLVGAGAAGPRAAIRVAAVLAVAAATAGLGLAAGGHTEFQVIR